MLTQVKMNDKQKALIVAAHTALEQSREKQQLNAVLAGIAAGLEGTLKSADTDASIFNLEVPDETSAGETP